ncbi:poliovirus receptor isoform X1 [Lepisosteus oculatus]|uniref:poliovirus receptor isoform X1 n=1 Tax=Lepisosteus oculatus TaxID=7918 RepID=UPI00371168AC
MARPLSREGALTALASLLLVQVVGCQHVKVEPEVLAYPGQDVTLRCQFVQDGEAKLTQVSWIWEPVNGQKQNIAVFHPNFGASYPSSPLKGRISFINSSLENPSIHITALVLGDEGKYTCEYATYPSGNDQGTTSLFVLVKPRSSADIITVPAGDSPVAVARCVAAGGRPAADVSWETAAQGNWTTVPTQNSDGTVTMTSEYLLAPTSEDNGKDISCVVKHKTLKIPARFPLKLFVEYPPQVKIFGYDNNWYIGRTEATLMCEATGNPSPTNVTWKLLSGQMPENVVISHNKLTVLKVDEAVNSTFVCEVNTRLGATREQISVNVREARETGTPAGVVAGAVIGTLLALLLLGALVAVLYTQHRRHKGAYRGGSQGAYDIKKRVFGGKKGDNNNGAPVYTFREDGSDTVAEKSGALQQGGGAPPTAQDILLGGEMDEGEKRKFDGLGEDEDESYDRFDESRPVLQLRRAGDDGGEDGGYLDDDMESQRDGSVISRTAVYV